MIAFVVYMQQNVYANDTIYVRSSMEFSWNKFYAQEDKIGVSIDEIKEEVFNTNDIEKYQLLNDKIYKVKNDAETLYELVEYSRSVPTNINCFKKLSDLEWWSERLKSLNNINEEVYSIMYNKNTYDYADRVNRLIVWLFTNDNIFITNISMKSKYDKSGALQEWLIDEPDKIETYSEWIDEVGYIGNGKCYFNDKLASDKVYFNDYKGTLPLRAAIEYAGGSIEWNDNLKQAIITYQDKMYTCYYYGKNGFRFDDEYGNPVALGRQSGLGRSFIIDDTTYLDELTARRVLDKLGIDYYFDVGNKELKLETRGRLV